MGRAKSSSFLPPPLGEVSRFMRDEEGLVTMPSPSPVAGLADSFPGERALYGGFAALSPSKQSDS